MNLPAAVSGLLSMLAGAGFSAWVVGGCVRDSLLGRAPNDWDLCTSAKPEEMKRVFHGLHTVETGLKHGTLTVVVDHVPYEVTTYRTDGAYTDHRRPDTVNFVDNLQEDLARRDFTVNAMAWSPEKGLADPFGGQADLAAGVIRCVGESDRRFEEDALRVLRALRFASQLGFTIEQETASALRSHAPDLQQIAGERLQAELLKLLCGKAAGDVLRQYPEVLGAFLPDLCPLLGYDQQNHHHRYDLWEHTVRAVEAIPPEPVLRLTMLLHDTGKPLVRSTDARGEGHYIGHPAVSARIACRAADILRLDNTFRTRLETLVLHHEDRLRKANGEVNTDRSFLLRMLNRLGEEDLRALFLIHCADRTATGYSTAEREKQRLQQRMNALDALLREEPCFTLRQLAVNGRDLLAAGYRGREIGAGLQSLLEAVMEGRIPNDREILLQNIHHFETNFKKN